MLRLLLRNLRFAFIALNSAQTLLVLSAYFLFRERRRMSRGSVFLRIAFYPLSFFPLVQVRMDLLFFILCRALAHYLKDTYKLCLRVNFAGTAGS